MGGGIAIADLLFRSYWRGGNPFAAVLVAALFAAPAIGLLLALARRGRSWKSAALWWHGSVLAFVFLFPIPRDEELIMPLLFATCSLCLVSVLLVVASAWLAVASRRRPAA